MKNDFFKHILLSSGSKQNRTELETETLPYTFNSNGHRLRNYRIYGNTVDDESVGDLVTEGEHSGEYLVPVTVTVDGKNYLQSSDFEAGAIYTGSNYKNWKYPNSKTPSGMTDYDSTRKRSTNLISVIGTYTISIADGWEFAIIMFPDRRNSGQTVIYYTLPVTISDCTFAIQLRKTDISDISSADISDYQIMLAKGSTAIPYEPYHAPDTTNLYLPEQIKMVGDEAEYIDFREQKQHFADGTSADVTLPAIPILSGTNTLSIGTAVQPSKIWIQGNVSEIPPVSASLNSIPQSLRMIDLSKDKVSEPENEDLQLDIVPVEKYVINLKDSEKTIEPTEIERGVESAE